MAERQRVAIPLDGTDFSRQILPYVRGLLDPERTEVILIRVTEDVDEGVSAETARPEAGARSDTERPFMPGGGHMEPFGPTPFTAEGDPQAVGCRGEPVYTVRFILGPQPGFANTRFLMLLPPVARCP